MAKVTMIGCDLHDETMVLKVAVNKRDPIVKRFKTREVAKVIEWARGFAEEKRSSRIVFAYEASGLGFGLYDDLTDAGIECFVLAPTHLSRSPHQRRNKTDEKDAEQILDILRSHVLGAGKLPAVWVPDRQTRDDREPVRMRLELATRRTRIKNQIRTLAKRVGLVFPSWFSKSGEWSKRSVQWLQNVGEEECAGERPGMCTVLSCLAESYQHLTQQIKQMDRVIAELAKTDRYRRAYYKLRTLPGVGMLTAMVFLTELGDLNRFPNRRKLSAYLGLAPTAHESGKQDDRKGRISRQGPARLRHLLCQAAWAGRRVSDKVRKDFERIQGTSPSRKKIALVAIMRRLGVLMWHTARSARLDPLVDGMEELETSARAQQKGPPLPSRLRSA